MDTTKNGAPLPQLHDERSTPGPGAQVNIVNSTASSTNERQIGSMPTGSFVRCKSNSRRRPSESAASTAISLSEQFAAARLSAGSIPYRVAVSACNPTTTVSWPRLRSTPFVHGRSHMDRVADQTLPISCARRDNNYRVRRGADQLAPTAAAAAGPGAAVPTYTNNIRPTVASPSAKTHRHAH